MSYKRIGIVGWNTGDNSFGITKPYAEFFNHFGQLVILGPSEETIDLDLVVLPGGKDISSYLYGRSPSFYNTDADLMKEAFLKQTLPAYIEKGTPIFGICLGMQQINVHFGGKMIQSIATHPTSTESRSELVHSLELFGGLSQYNGTTKKDQFYVNSLHRQAVDPNHFPDCLEVLGQSRSKRPVIEIIRHRELPIAGVQYHPEEIYDKASIYLISELLAYETVANQSTGA